MGTRNNPGMFNCYASALPDEEVFTVLGRDPATPATIRFWVAERQRLGKVVTMDDQQRMREALVVADRAEDWRARMIEAAGEDGDPVWRLPRPAGLDDGPAIRTTPELRWSADPDEDGQIVKPLSASRICELLDYATCYGEFDENTPNGTISKYGEKMSSPMNDIRRHAIWVYKKVLGLLPEDASPPPVEPPVSMRLPGSTTTFAFGDAEMDRTYIQIGPEMDVSLAVLVDTYRKSIKPPKPNGGPVDSINGKPTARDVTEIDTPELPPHRFAMFDKGKGWAYGRGLEINPTHIPAMLDRMEADGYTLVAALGSQADKVGMIFRRGPRYTAFELAHGFGGGFDREGFEKAIVESPELQRFKAGESLDTIRAEGPCAPDDEECLRRIGMGRGQMP